VASGRPGPRSPTTALVQLGYWKPARKAGAAPDLLVDLATLKLPPVYEEASGHWGAHLRLNLETPCGACTVPLVDPVATSVALSSVALFRCGHAFHTLCAPEGACPICLHARVGPLLSLATDALVPRP
jgi:hypothetical protein